MKKTIITIALVALVMGATYLFTANRAKPIIQKEADQTSAHAIRYLPLGDSYTIGQSVAEDQRWPNQLVTRLKADSVDIGIVANPSVTGFTTKNLIDHELPLLDSYNPNFVTILIGVNDYVQGVPADTTAKNLRQIIDTVQKNVPTNRIVLVTIPDYAKTPTGARFGDPRASSLAIKALNDIIQDEGKKRGILVVDIYSISQQVIQDPDLTADDGLHPSGQQYSLWTDAINQAITQQKTFTR